LHQPALVRVCALPLLLVLTAGAIPVAAQTTPAEPPQTPAPEEQKKEPAPEHVSTSWKTLLKDTAGDFVAFPKRQSTWVLLGIGAGAALAVHPADDYVASHIVGNDAADKFFSLGKVLGHTYTQVGTAVGLWAIGRYVIAPVENEPKTNKYSEVGFDLMRAQIVGHTIAHSMKPAFRRDRPTGECCSFPSGHATSAFAAAAVLERHFGYRASWPAIAGAMYVATSRLVDNRHFLSDVMFGAAVGTAAGWTVVGARGRNNEYVVQPVPVPGGMMIAVIRLRSP
jgi:hypothetical protein